MLSHRVDPDRDSARRSRGWELSATAVRALAVFAAAVAVVAAVLAWQARPDVEPLASPSTSVNRTSHGSVSAPSESPGVVVVAVSGRVARPGLVRLPAGARVADAIEAAGGALPGTDLTMVNLARRVIDGELIAVGIPQPSATAEAGPGVPGEPVNLNTATREQLQTLPGVGPVLAERIVDYREQHGGFRAVADLREVSGIGDARYNELKDLVTV